MAIFHVCHAEDTIWKFCPRQASHLHSPIQRHLHSVTLSGTQKVDWLSISRLLSRLLKLTYSNHFYTPSCSFFKGLKWIGTLDSSSSSLSLYSKSIVMSHWNFLKEVLQLSVPFMLCHLFIPACSMAGAGHTVLPTWATLPLTLPALPPLPVATLTFALDSR